MEPNEPNNKKKWSKKDEEKYIDEVYESAKQINSHREEFGGYVAISADTVILLVESYKELQELYKK